MINKIYGNMSSILLMCIFIVMSIAQFIFYNQDISEYRNEIKYIDTMKKEVEWSFVSSVFDTVRMEANEKANTIAQNIIMDIKHEYPDLSVLKTHLDNGNIEKTKLPIIVYKNLYNNYFFNVKNNDNNPLVISCDGYIMDYSITKYGQSWHVFDKEDLFNPDELYLTLDSTKNFRDNNIICISKSSSENFTTEIKLLNKEKIKEVFYENGLYGLKDYVFLGTSYITETGDIFGTSDINENAVKVNNHKLIVLQKYNLYDIINYHYIKELQLNSHMLNDVKKDMEHSMFMRSITYMGLLILNIIAMLIIIFWSNKNQTAEKK